MACLPSADEIYHWHSCWWPCVESLHAKATHSGQWENTLNSWARSTAHAEAPGHSIIWIWVTLLVAGAAVLVCLQSASDCSLLVHWPVDDERGWRGDDGGGWTRYGSSWPWLMQSVVIGIYVSKTAAARRKRTVPGNLIPNNWKVKWVPALILTWCPSEDCNWWEFITLCGRCRLLLSTTDRDVTQP